MSLKKTVIAMALAGAATLFGLVAWARTTAATVITVEGMVVTAVAAGTGSRHGLD